jgi:hypothetical protein
MSAGIKLSFGNAVYTTEYEIIDAAGKRTGGAHDLGKYIVSVTKWMPEAAAQNEQPNLYKVGKLTSDIHIRHKGVTHKYKKDSRVLMQQDDSLRAVILNEQAGGRRRRASKSKSKSKSKHRFTRRR